MCRAMVVPVHDTYKLPLMSLAAWRRALGMVAVAVVLAEAGRLLRRQKHKGWGEHRRRWGCLWFGVRRTGCCRAAAAVIGQQCLVRHAKHKTLTPHQLKKDTEQDKPGKHLECPSEIFIDIRLPGVVSASAITSRCSAPRCSVPSSRPSRHVSVVRGACGRLGRHLAKRTGSSLLLPIGYPHGCHGQRRR